LILLELVGAKFAGWGPPCPPPLNQPMFVLFGPLWLDTVAVLLKAPPTASPGRYKIFLHSRGARLVLLELAEGQVRRAAWPLATAPPYGPAYWTLWPDALAYYSQS